MTMIFLAFIVTLVATFAVIDAAAAAVSWQNISSLLYSRHYPTVLKTFQYIQEQQKSLHLENFTYVFPSMTGVAVFISDFSFFDLHNQRGVPDIPPLESDLSSDRVLLCWGGGLGLEYTVVDFNKKILNPPRDGNYRDKSSVEYAPFTNLRSRDVFESCSNSATGQNRKSSFAYGVRFLHFHNQLLMMYHLPNNQVPIHGFRDLKASYFLTHAVYNTPMDAFFHSNAPSLLTITAESEAFFYSLIAPASYPTNSNNYPLPVLNRGKPDEIHRYISNDSSNIDIDKVQIFRERPFIYPDNTDDTNWSVFIFNMRVLRFGVGAIGPSQQEKSFLNRFQLAVQKKYPPLMVSSADKVQPEDDIVLFVQSIQPHRVLFAPHFHLYANVTDDLNRDPNAMGLHTLAATYLIPSNTDAETFLNNTSSKTPLYTEVKRKPNLWRSSTSSASTSSSSSSSRRKHLRNGSKTPPRSTLDVSFLWPYGTPQPGTPATLVFHEAVGGFKYLAFFSSSVTHSSKSNNNNNNNVRFEDVFSETPLRDTRDHDTRTPPAETYATHYLGAYLFETHPPFAITHMTRQPLSCSICYDEGQFPKPPNQDFGLSPMSFVLRPSRGGDKGQETNDNSGSDGDNFETVVVDLSVSLNHQQGVAIVSYDLSVLLSRFLISVESETDVVVVTDALSETQEALSVLDEAMKRSTAKTRRTTHDLASAAYKSIDRQLR